MICDGYGGDGRDEGLKALSARVVRAAPNDAAGHIMRAAVLTPMIDACKAGPRSAAELSEAAAHWERAAVLSDMPVVKADSARRAAACRGLAAVM